MKKLNHWVALVTLAAVTVFTACEKKEIGHTMEFPQSSVSEQFFAYDGGVRLLEEVIGFLKEKNDSTEFISGFMDTYGYPVWHDAVYVHHETDSVLGIFVPVHNKQFREIESIWTFRLTPGKIRYYVVERKNVNEEEAKWTFDLFTQEVLGVQPESGNIFKPVDKELVTRSTLFITHCNDIYTGSASGGLTYKYTHCWTEILNIPSFGGGGPIGNGDGDIDSYMYMMPYDGNGGGGGGYSPTPEDTEEIIIDPSFKNTKAECVYEKLISLSGGFKSAMDKFSGKTPIGGHLKFVVVPNISSTTPGTIIAAVTESPSNYVTAIKFNNEYLNMGFSDLTYARTMIHESIHAEMFRKLLSLSQTPNFNLSSETIKEMEKNFNGIYDYFTRYFYNEYVETFNADQDLFNKKQKYFEGQMIDWQHQMMATHYIKTMSKMLYDFCEGEYTLEQCEMFSFSGLMTTVAWNDVKNKEEVKSLINQIMNNGSKKCP